MKRTTLILLSLIAVLTACHKDDDPTIVPQEEHFSMQGKWFNPDINSWYQHVYDPYGGGSWYYWAWEQDNFYKTIEFTDECQVGEQWQGCFKWNRMSYDPVAARIDLDEPYTYYYKVNDSSTRIILYCPTWDNQIRDVPFQIISPNEMMTDGELYIRITDNPTPMVTLPNRNWHYDWDSNGFYYTGSGAGMYDYNNPSYEQRDNGLYVYWGTNMNQSVRPCANYASLPAMPRGTFDCTSRQISFTMQQIDYNGTQRWAYVQNSGGKWFDRICEYAFAGCKELNTLKLSNQIIEDYAFYGCSLKDIFLMSIPDSVAETAFDEWQYEHTVLHTKQLVHTGPWNRFKHSYVDIPEGEVY
ncbi:MAG: leucine-rich repeat protein [bacterium]